jgi:hypothetical protein
MRVASHRRRSPSSAGNNPRFTGIQGDFFQQLEAEAEVPAGADLDYHFQLLGAVKTAIAHARTLGLKREGIVERMNRLLPELDRPITLRQLNSWTAASKEYSEFPARFLPAFCVVTECSEPLRVLAGGIGMDLIDARERAFKRLGEIDIEVGRAKREQAQIKRTLGG